MRRVWPLALTIAVVASTCGGDSTETTDPEPTVESSDVTTSTSTMSTTVAEPDEEPDEETGTTEASSTQSNSGSGGCTITVSGDIEETIDYPDSLFFSDYWSSEEELREYVEFMGEDILEGTYEELVARDEPIITWFNLNCMDPQDPGPGIQVFHTNATTSDQLPMGPGTYPVSGGLFDADGPPATVITNLALTLDEQFHPVPDSGEMVISSWDTSMLEGVLTFDGEEIFPEGEPRTVSVVVDFAFECAPTHSGCG